MSFPIIFKTGGLIQEGLLAYFDFFNDGTNSQVLRNLANPSQNGQLGTTAGADSNDPVWVSHALDFDGSDDVVTLPANSVTTSFADFSFEAWINRDNVSGWQTIFGAGTNGDQPFFGISSTDKIAVFSGEGTAAGSVSVPHSQWRHVAATRKGSNYRFFHMGAFSTQAVVGAGNPINPASSARLIGSDNGTEDFSGLIAHFAVYRRQLADGEIRQNFDFTNALLKERGIL